MFHEFRCNYPEAACVTRRLFYFFQLYFRYQQATLYYREIAFLVNASIPSDRQYTVERLAMEILEAQNDLYLDQLAEPIQEILDRCHVKALKLDELSEDQARERLDSRSGALQSLRDRKTVETLEKIYLSPCQ